MKNIDKSFSLLQLVLAGLKKDYPTKYVDWVCKEWRKRHTTVKIG